MKNKTLFIMLIVLVLLSVSCRHAADLKTDEFTDDFNRMGVYEVEMNHQVPFEGMMEPPEWGRPMVGGMPMIGQMGEEGEFFSTVDKAIYASSVSSPDNPLTYYDEEDVLNENEYQILEIILSEGEYETTTLPLGLSIIKDENGSLVIKNKSDLKLNYVLSGKWNGTVVITNDNSSYMVTLNSMEIVGDILPSMQLKSTTKAFLLLKGDNFLSDAQTNSKKGALTCSGDVIIQGDGSLTITAYKKHGLKVDGTVRLVSGTLYVITDEGAEGNAISVDDAYIQDGGSLHIEAKGSVYGSESKGLKVNGRELDENAKGYLVINGGYVDIVSVGKAMSAGWKIEEDKETESTLDDPTPNLIINGGVIQIKTTGMPYEVSEEESLSPEGIEAKNLLAINGGLIEIIATDDGINSGKAFELNGGFVFVYSRMADGVDSNGTVVINGGMMVALGSGAPEGGIDCDDDGAFTYHGGLVLGMGGMNNGPGAEGTDHAAISLTLPVAAGSSFAIVDEVGNILLAYTVPTYYQTGMMMELLSEDLVIGHTYRVLSDVSVHSTEIINGLSIGNVSIAGGAEASAITVTSYVNGATGMFAGRGGKNEHHPEALKEDFRGKGFGEEPGQRGMRPEFGMEPPMDARPVWN